MLLTIAVPTWKRPEKLRVLLSSIAEEVSQHDDVRVIVSDHGSDDETPEVIREFSERYPFIRGILLAREHHHDYSHAFRFLFQQTDTEWTWTIGDDDKIIRGAIQNIRSLLERDDLEFIHVSEVSRSQNTGALIKGNLMDLCDAIGWIDMTGFISCNITRTKWLKEAANLPSWDLYAKNAFVQSCALLEVLRDKPCAFYDAPLVSTQSDELSEETMLRWGQFNVGLRYHYIDDALIDMRRRGIIKRALKPKFFRYLSYYLWDRAIQQIYNSYNSDQDFKVTDYLVDLFQRTLNLTKFLEPSEERRYAEEILEVKRGLIEHQQVMEEAIRIAGRIGHLVDDHGQDRFPFRYIKKDIKKESAA